MAAVTKLHFCTFHKDQLFYFKGQQRNWLKRGCGARFPVITRNRYRVYVQKCRSFRGEDGGEVEEKEMESERKYGVLMENELKLEKEDGFWKSLKSAVFGVSKFGSKSRDEHEKAVAKVDEVFSSVSLYKIVNSVLLIEFLSFQFPFWNFLFFIIQFQLT